MGGIVQVWSVKRSVVRTSENRYMDANMPLDGKISLRRNRTDIGRNPHAGGKKDET